MKTKTKTKRKKKGSAAAKSETWEGDTFEASTVVTFACPFCGRFAKFVHVKNDDGTTEPAVMHAVPQCTTFETMSAVEFARAVNAHLRVTIGGEAKRGQA